MLAALLTAALALAAHNSSIGTHSFLVHVDGTVDVEVALHDDDAFDLCALTPTDPAADGAALRGCFARTLPARLRVTLDGAPCPLQLDRLDLAQETLSLFATAACPAGQHWWTPAQLVIDWGLFAGTGRAHVSTGHLALPGVFMGESQLRQTRLATDAPKLAVAVPPRLPGLPFALGTVALAALVWRWRRRSAAK